jgi:ABC-type transport system involved in multi-copper enzyme maturation permease subunit
MDRERSRRALLVTGQIALLLIVLSRLATSSWSLPIAFLLLGIVVAALFAWVWLYLTNSSIDLTESHLVITDWRGSTKAIARAQVSRLIRIGVEPFEGPPRHAVIAVDSADRCLFAFGAAFDSAAIARSLSVPLSGSFNDVVSLREVNRRYPGATGGVVASSQLVFVLTIVATVVGGVIAFMVWTAMRS